MKQNKESFNVIQKVKEFVNENKLISSGDEILVGLSGGADSVCLIHVLSKLRESIGFNIRAVHVHHGIREISADRDAEFVKKLCNEMGIELSVKYVDIPGEAKKTGESIEECARRIRYEVFRKEKNGNSKIAVAHHIDDQAETVIFRMIRGTGIKGLQGMIPINGDLIRPLLCLTREEIIKYIDSEKLSYCIDETNNDVEYSRNLIRHNIMAEANKICPQAAVHIYQLSKDAAEMEEYTQKKAFELYNTALIAGDFPGIVLNADMITQAEPIIARMAVKIAIDNMIHSLKDITREHVDSICRLCNGNESSKVNLPKKLVVIKEGNELSFIINEGTDNIAKEKHYKVRIPGETILSDGRCLNVEISSCQGCDDIPRNLYTKWFDYDKINAGLCVRTRQNGDFFISDNKGSHKNLSRYLIDEKVPKSKRDEILVLASGSEVYWIIGYRISESVKITDSTTCIMKCDIKEKNHERKD